VLGRIFGPKRDQVIGGFEVFTAVVMQSIIFWDMTPCSPLSHIPEDDTLQVVGGWRILHNEELHNLYSSLSIIRMIKSRTMRWAWHVARMGKTAYRILLGNPEGKRPLGRPRRR
jgi:hypothetical protein